MLDSALHTVIGAREHDVDRDTGLVEEERSSAAESVSARRTRPPTVSRQAASSGTWGMS
ncbi:hypothetical protein [Streptomyces sp. NPDC054834]